MDFLFFDISLLRTPQTPEPVLARKNIKNVGQLVDISFARCY